MTHPVSRIHSTSGFQKSFRRLSHHIQDIAVKKDALFRQDAFNPLLHAHKLKGEMEGYYSYRINRAYRVLFRFIEKNEVIYYDIGTHDIYR